MVNVVFKDSLEEYASIKTWPFSSWTIVGINPLSSKFSNEINASVSLIVPLYRDIPIFEYSPRKIKQSITGNGGSSKEQVAKMLQNILRFTEMPKELDATDGLAVAVCHFYQGNTIGGEKKYSGWKSFVSNNPDKVKKS